MKKFLAVILGLVMVLAFGSAATASSLNINFGGTLQLGYYYNETLDQIEDVSWLSYYELTLGMSKNFGDLGSAGVTFKTAGGLYGLNDPWGDPYEVPKSWGSPNGFKFNSWYYDYKVSDALTVGLTGSAGGISISDGELTNNSDWQKVCGFKGKVDYGVAKGPQLPTVLKVVANPATGLTTSLYYYPVDSNFIIKGQYQGDSFRIGGGYNNIDEQAKLRDDNDDNPIAEVDFPIHWDIYGEIVPVDGVKIYGEYREDGEYLVTAMAQVLDSLKLDLMYSSRSKISAGYILYRCDTVDIKGTYNLGEGNRIAGGIAYDTNYSDLARIYAEYSFDKFTIGVSDEFLEKVMVKEPREEVVNSNYGITVYGSYKLDGTNTVRASYNLDNGRWAAYMQISLW